MCHQSLWISFTTKTICRSRIKVLPTAKQIRRWWEKCAWFTGVYLMQIDKSKACFFLKLAALFFSLFLSFWPFKNLFTTFNFALILIHQWKKEKEREKKMILLFFFDKKYADENQRQYCSGDGRMIASKTCIWRSQLLPIQLHHPTERKECFLIKIYYQAVKCTVGRWKKSKPNIMNIF